MTEMGDRHSPFPFSWNREKVVRRQRRRAELGTSNDAEPQKKKSSGVTSGDLGGQAIGTQRPIHRLGKAAAHHLVAVSAQSAFCTHTASVFDEAHYE
ncbi:hypothetical protein AVEN_263707-1 [Araneus ventricosus]|uniref:Uncharacterized protein n=1 Tax=Araneus ventricosus TaxID=182803 RepID=A0A4Y2ARP9_ARAVE|nr:hypothetical protein AVEN_263707-1 [Araneus ventricosus]